MKTNYITLVLLPFLMGGCEHSPDEIKELIDEKPVSVSYKDVSLNWDTNSFKHNGMTIHIPETWYSGLVKQKREEFKNLDAHDIKFQYDHKRYLSYGGQIIDKASFKDLDEEKPNNKDKIFEISVVGLDIDSKITIKDELINDCYFKYDTNSEFYNFCYFKIAKNDVNQLKAGYFNQINVRLECLEHYDAAVSFKTHEDDGLNNVGYYSEVSIQHNPDLE